jgi:hypothetical protein
MSREWGEKAVLGLMGYVGDSLLDASILAAKAPWLLDETSPQDAVDLQADETGIRRYASDTDATHRARVASPWDAYTYAGSKDGIGEDGQGLEGQLHLLGYPNALTIADYEWSVPDPAHWSRFWVLIPETDHSWTDDGAWDDPGTWDDGGVWDLTASDEEIRSLRNLIRQWKSGHEICAGIIILRGGELWDYPSGPWSDPGNWDDGLQAITISAV